jgi:hypothetical protein
MTIKRIRTKINTKFKLNQILRDKIEWKKIKNKIYRN